MKLEHILNWCDNGPYEVNKGYSWEKFLDICNKCEFALWADEERFYPRRFIKFPYKNDIEDAQKISFYNGSHADIMLEKEHNTLIRVVDSTFLLRSTVEIMKEDDNPDDDGYVTFSRTGKFRYKDIKIKFVGWKLFD